MAIRFLSKRTGKQVTLLSPKEKGRKAAAELRENVHLTNEGNYKTDRDGSLRGLTAEERAYRSGYLDARKDIGKAHAAAGRNKKQLTIR